MAERIRAPWHGTWFPPSAGSEAAAHFHDADAAAYPDDSSMSGGTSHILPFERSRASFKTHEMTLLIDGGEKATARRRFIWSESEGTDNSNIHNKSRVDVISNHVKHFTEIHKPYVNRGFKPTPTDIMYMNTVARNNGAFGLHMTAFTSTLNSQMTEEQKSIWLGRARKMKIFGALVQTELGHGSNVRGLRTTAHFDQANQQFVLNTPDLLSLKWWPGGLGMTATHGALYAQLILPSGKSMGVHTFLIQLRDQHHNPLPGIEVGEIGPKIGDNSVETGFLRLTNVRIPRDWMMMRFASVTPTGEYLPVRKPKPEPEPKPEPKPEPTPKTKTEADKHLKGSSHKKNALTYVTMVKIRAGLVKTSGFRLAQGATVAVRYSCVRQQGFQDPSVSDHMSAERSVLDYQNQAYRVLKQLALSYAFVFVGVQMDHMLVQLNEAIKAEGDADLSFLPEMHATTAALKALCTYDCANGIEECRKCCGGHGVMLASGVAANAMEYLPMVTAEGDKVILELQTARFLVNTLRRARSGETVSSGACSYVSRSLGNTCRASDSNTFKQLHVLQDLFQQRAFMAVSSVTDALDLLHGDVDAWNKCSVDLEHAARCHVHSFMLRCFAERIEQSPRASLDQQNALAVLEKVAILYALTEAVEHLGDWIGYIGVAQAGALKVAQREMLTELRPEAVSLVDAFEFPDLALNSAIGRHDGRAYEGLYQSARESRLNSKDSMKQVAQSLAPYLDKAFIAEQAKKMGHGALLAKL